MEFSPPQRKSRVTTFAAIMSLTGAALFGWPFGARAALGPPQTFTEPTPVAQDMFGVNSNYVSGDGRTALVGAPGATVSGNFSAGKVYVYSNVNGTWTAGPMIANPAPQNGAQFGRATALSQNGNVAIIGAPGLSGPGVSAVGVVYLYAFSNGAWTKTAAINDPAPASAGDGFGAHIALSDDGTTALIAAPGKSAGAGTVFVYRNVSGTWTQVAAFTQPGNTQPANFGVSAGLSGDGTKAVIGNMNGSWYAYNQTNGTWGSNPSQTFSGGQNQQFGISVAISEDGLTAFAGCPGCNTSGTVTVYNFAAGTWTQSATITDLYPGARSGDLFGYGLAANGNGTQVLIGSGTAVNGNVQQGVAFLFDLAGGTWTESQELDDPAAGNGDDFSFSSVSLANDGSAAFIGAANTKVSGQSSAGAVYGYVAAAASVDLGVTLAALPNQALSNQTVALDATVTNHNSTTAATNVKLQFTLTSITVYQSASVAGGACSVSGLIVTCTLTSLAANATWQPSVSVTINTSGVAVLSAQVSADEPDPVTSNNAATVTVTATAAPVANNGTLTIPPGGSPNGTLNATGTGTLTFAATQPQHGTVVLTNVNNGDFTYTPSSGFTGTDSFTFTVSNAGGTSNTATETIVVQAASGGSGSGSGGGSGNSSSSGASGKSGGGALGWLGLGLLSLFLGRRRRTINRSES